MHARIQAGFILIIIMLLLSALTGLLAQPAYAQDEGSPTATLRPEAVYITVTYGEPINVRGGPNSVYYPVVGSLPVGAVAQALGRSLAGEWVQIVFPAATDGSGTGWVYSPLVTLSGGFLPVVEPPPTAIPVFAPTLDPDFITSLQPAATSTRPPTFTAPVPLVLPTFENPVTDRAGTSSGVFILILGGMGLLGVMFVSLRHKR